MRASLHFCPSAMMLLMALIASSVSAQTFMRFEELIALSDSLPPVTLRKPADFIFIVVEVENDSREEIQRREEIYSTIRRAATTEGRVKLHSGEDAIPSTAFRVPLRAGSRPDTTATSFYARVPLRPDDDVWNLREELAAHILATGHTTARFYARVPLTDRDDEWTLRAELTRYIESIEVEGRTLMKPGQAGLGMEDL